MAYLSLLPWRSDFLWSLIGKPLDHLTFLKSVEGANDLDGHSNDHFFTSTLSFTLIIHIIIYKLFLETTFWNPITIVTCLVCFFLYYIVIILGNVHTLSSFFQPQLNGQVWLLLSSPKFWILLIVVPLFALVPDLTINICQRIFFPTPFDAVMLA